MHRKDNELRDRIKRLLHELLEYHQGTSNVVLSGVSGNSRKRTKTIANLSLIHSELCKICGMPVDSMRRPMMSLKSCGHTFCVICAKKMTKKKCIICGDRFNSWNNLDLLRTVPKIVKRSQELRLERSRMKKEFKQRLELELSQEKATREENLKTLQQSHKRDLKEHAKNYRKNLIELQIQRESIRKGMENESKKRKQQYCREKEEYEHRIQERKKLRNDHQLMMREDREEVEKEISLFAKKQLELGKMQNVHISCRIIPCSAESRMKKLVDSMLHVKSQENDTSVCVRVISNQTSRGEARKALQVDRILPGTTNPRKVKSLYEFDEFFQDSDNSHLHSSIGDKLVELTVSGMNSCCFAYGATGTGKSYTMFGQENLYSEMDLGNQKNQQLKTVTERISQNSSKQGLIVYFLKQLFSTMPLKYPNRFSIQISAVEIYMKKTRDLLNKRGKFLKNSIHETDNHEIYVDGLEKHAAVSEKDAIELIKRGYNNRSCSPNEKNLVSSRSHVVFTVYVTFFPLQHDHRHVLQAKCNLVDLAGSESIGALKLRSFPKCGIKPVTIYSEKLEKEAKSINNDLLQLNICLNRMAEASQENIMSENYISCRGSPLTWMLYDSMTNGGKNFLLTTVSQVSSNVADTLNSVRFAIQAKKIKLSVKQNPIKTWTVKLGEILESLYQLLVYFKDSLQLSTGKTPSKRTKTLALKIKKRLRLTLIILKRAILEFGVGDVSFSLESIFESLRNHRSENLYYQLLALLYHQLDEPEVFAFVDRDVMVYHLELLDSCPHLRDMKITLGPSDVIQGVTSFAGSIELDEDLNSSAGLLLQTSIQIAHRKHLKFIPNNQSPPTVHAAPKSPITYNTTQTSS